ncbi:MAG TPA: ABC transporter permease [Gaiellaceae bacterium]|nr:ABC transporter permease [Gaiellaceae bacterium]
MTLFWHQLKSEQLVFWRSREAAIFVFLFPPLLFVLLASVFGDGTRDGIPASTYLVGGLIAYAAANTALGGLAITLVIRREYGILKRLRSTPLPAPLYLTAVLLSNLLVVVLQSFVVVALGLGLFDAQLPENWLSFLLALGLGAASFAGLGLAITALVRSGEAIAAVVNVIILPMSFLSGSFGPADELPGFLAALRDVLPLRYLIDVVLGAYVDGDALWEHPTAIAVLAAWGAGGYVVARRRFGWEPRER